MATELHGVIIPIWHDDWIVAGVPDLKKGSVVEVKFGEADDWVAYPARIPNGPVHGIVTAIAPGWCKVLSHIRV